MTPITFSREERWGTLWFVIELRARPGNRPTAPPRVQQRHQAKGPPTRIRSDALSPPLQPPARQAPRSDPGARMLSMIRSSQRVYAIKAFLFSPGATITEAKSG